MTKKILVFLECGMFVLYQDSGLAIIAIWRSSKQLNKFVST
jgi:hypothetical protein